jgi:hypothetical protein
MRLRWKLDAIELLAGILIFLVVWAVRCVMFDKQFLTVVPSRFPDAAAT